MKLCNPETQIEIDLTPVELEVIGSIALDLRVPVTQLVREALGRGLTVHADKLNKDFQI